MANSPERATAVISSREQADEVMRKYGIDPQFEPVSKLKEFLRMCRADISHDEYLELNRVRDFLRLQAYETQINDILTILTRKTRLRRGRFEPITNRQRRALEGQFIRLRQLSSLALITRRR